MPDGAYLPPVVAEMVANAKELFTTLSAAAAALDKFDKTRVEATLTADGDPAVEEALRTRAAVDAIMERPIRGTLSLDTTAATAAAAAVGAAAGGRGGRGGGGNIGLLAAMGFGGGGGRFLGIPGTGLLGGLAGFGTLGGLAGFGIEHVLGIGLGLAGSAGSALGGGALLGAGALGTTAVGAGSDMAVMKSTIADTQTLSKAYVKLAQDTQLYGANSKQAKADTQALNDQMKLLGNTAGVQAELGVAKLAHTINEQWDRASSGARVQAAGLMTQVLTLGQTYVPLVSASAATNLGIINTNLKPLFAWLEGPQGKGIFLDLESIFARRLPVAINAFDNGLELLIKTVDYAANKSTGGFIQRIDDLTKRFNSPEGFAQWETHIDHAVTRFHEWGALIVVAGKDVMGLFRQSADLGDGIVVSLTAMLDRLHAWEQSDTGKATLAAYFQASKTEVLALLQWLPVLISTFGQLFTAIEPPLRLIVSFLSQTLLFLTQIPGVGPIIAWGLAFAFVYSKLSPVVTLLKGLGGGLSGAGAAAGAEAAAGGAALGAEGGMLGGLMSKVGGFMTGPYGIALAAIGATALVVAANWDSISKAFQSSTDKLRDFQSQLDSARSDAQKALAASLSTPAQQAAFAAHTLTPGATQTFTPSGEFAAALSQSSSAVSGYQSAVDALDRAQAQAYADMKNGATQSYVNSIAFNSQGDTLDTLRLKVQEAAASYKAMGIIPYVTNNLTNFSAGAQSIFQQLGKDVPAINAFGLGLQNPSGNIQTAIEALNGLSATDPGVAKLIGTLQKEATVTFSDQVTSANNFRDALLGTLTPIGQAANGTAIYSAKQQAWVNQMVSQMFPTLKDAQTNLQNEANVITGGNIPALQLLIGQNSAVVDALMLQAGWVQNAAGSWVNLAGAAAAAQAQVAKTIGQNVGNYTVTSSGVTHHFASGGWLHSGWNVVGELGPELAWAGPSGTLIFPNQAGRTQMALSGGGRGAVTINAPVTVAVQGGATPQTAQAIGMAVSTAVQREMSAVMRALNSGAYEVATG